jgi:CBS domain-containing protein
MKASDIMATNVITIPADASVGEAASTLLNNHISGAPVVDEKGELVGIVSEGDLMRRPEIGTSRSELRKQVIARLAAEPWRPLMLTVTVQDGTVEPWGLVQSVEVKKAAGLTAEHTPGVRAVIDNIIVQPAGSAWQH